MTLTEEQMGEMEIAAMPLKVWLEKNCHPHVMMLVDSQDATLFEGIAAARKDFAEKTRPSRF